MTTCQFPQFLRQYQDSNKNMPFSKRLNETLTRKTADSSVVASVANLEAQIKINIETFQNNGQCGSTLQSAFDFLTHK